MVSPSDGDIVNVKGCSPTKILMIPKKVYCEVKRHHNRTNRQHSLG